MRARAHTRARTRSHTRANEHARHNAHHTATAAGCRWRCIQSANVRESQAPSATRQQGHRECNFGNKGTKFVNKGCNSAIRVRNSAIRACNSTMRIHNSGIRARACGNTRLTSCMKRSANGYAGIVAMCCAEYLTTHVAPQSTGTMSAREYPESPRIPPSTTEYP
jgi:hypothetical protein